MRAQSTGPILTAVFVDYDNIYLSLKRKNDEAAKRFAKDAGLWLREIETGRLITPTGAAAFASYPRRIVMNRCYGNPVPRRNGNDNSTDMNSFPFMRHHFLRAGFEAIDCPPLTSQLKNSADIKMVLDIGDLLKHETYFEEFIILSGDADFTPVLHRLRAHARRSVVFANDHTAAPYTAISDGEIRESNLVALLLEGRLTDDADQRPTLEQMNPTGAQLEEIRRDVVAEVVNAVRTAPRPVPLEALADRAVRALGHDRTVGTAWGGAGSFRDLLAKGLPGSVRLSPEPPYYVFDASRQLTSEMAPRPDVPMRRSEYRDEPPVDRRETMRDEGSAPRDDRMMTAAGLLPASAGPQGQWGQRAPAHAPAPSGVPAPRGQDTLYAPQAPLGAPLPHETAARAPGPSRPAEPASGIQQSIERIHQACQAPPLSPPEYRILFEVMAREIGTNNLAGTQTLANIGAAAREMGLEVSRDDIRFVLEVVSEPDPWFEQGASASLFASRFRNFVVARCRGQGLNLSADEIDLIDAWFGGPALASRSGPAYPQAQGHDAGRPQAPSAPGGPMSGAGAQGAPYGGRDRWPLPGGAVTDTGSAGGYGAAPSDDEFPRIVRTRLRG